MTQRYSKAKANLCVHKFRETSLKTTRWPPGGPTCPNDNNMPRHHSEVLHVAEHMKCLNRRDIVEGEGVHGIGRGIPLEKKRGTRPVVRKPTSDMKL